MLRDIKGTQRLPRMLGLRITGTGTAAVAEGGTDVTLTDNGTGDYTLTFAKAFARVPVVVVSTLTADVICQVSTPAADSVDILCFDATDGTTAKDADFHVMVLGWDAEDSN